jgi:hypothetical protein
MCCIHYLFLEFGLIIFLYLSNDKPQLMITSSFNLIQRAVLEVQLLVFVDWWFATLTGSVIVSPTCFDLVSS